MRKIKDAIDLENNEKVYFKGHAKATYMSDGSTVEDAVNNATIIAETAKNAVSTLEGLSNATEAMKTLAAQVVQIEENKQNIAANKKDVDEKLSELGSEVNNVRKDITGEYEFIFPVEENKAIAKNTYILPFVANEGDILTWNVEGTTFTNVYVYYTGDSTETAIGAASGYKLSKSIDRVTFAANRAHLRNKTARQVYFLLCGGFNLILTVIILVKILPWG